MASNDTPNILSAPLETASGGTIPANKVTYDGTGTSIVATNVQNAITELDTDLQSTKDDVDTLKTELTDTYIIGDTSLDISVTADGDKTYSTLLSELYTAFMTAVSELEDDEYIYPLSLYLSNTGDLDIRVEKSTGYSNADTSATLRGSRLFVRNDAIVSHEVTVATSPIFNYATITATPAVTISNYLTEKPDADVVFRVKGWILKKV